MISIVDFTHINYIHGCEIELPRSFKFRFSLSLMSHSPDVLQVITNMTESKFTVQITVVDRTTDDSLLKRPFTRFYISSRGFFRQLEVVLKLVTGQFNLEKPEQETWAVILDQLRLLCEKNCQNRLKLNFQLRLILNSIYNNPPVWSSTFFSGHFGKLISNTFT